jgi:subtilisin family serine protease
LGTDTAALTAPVEDAVNNVVGGDSETSSSSESGALTTEESADDDSSASDSATAETESKENEVAARSDDDSATDRARRLPSEGCKGEQCFASSLIKWHSDLRSCTKEVKVGIIDTSFDISHPTFRRMKGSSGQFLNGESPSTHDWHGTAVLSLLAGDPASNTPGLIPDANFYLATAFKTDEAGNASTDTVRLLQALDWLDALDVRYINMSFSGPRDPLFEKAIERMAAKGTVFVAAAGNQGPTAPPSYPAAYPQVIAVTAVNRNAENYRHANRGPYVDLSAPGVEIMTALPDGKQGFRTGTSFAAPFVTAIVATRSDPSRSFARKGDLLKSLNLQDLGPPGPDPIYGQGLALAPRVCKGSDGVIAHKEGPSLVPKFTAAGAAINISGR